MGFVWSDVAQEDEVGDLFVWEDVWGHTLTKANRVGYTIVFELFA